MLVTVLSTVTNIFILAQGVKFETLTFSEAKSKASKEGKILFVDCYTTWCGPCKMLSKNIFPNDTVGTFFNKHFVNLKIDMEKGEGTELGKKFGVTSYPTLLFINPVNEDVVYRLIGAKSNIEWLISAAEKAIDPKQNLQGLAALYNQNKQDSQAASNYLRCLNSFSMSHEKDSVLTDYLSNISNQDRYTIENWKIIEDFVTDIYSPNFSYLQVHSASFIQTVGNKAVNNKIEAVCNAAVSSFIRRKRIPSEQFPEAKFNELFSLLQNMNEDQTSYHLARLELVRQVQRGDYNKMLDEMEKALQQEALSSPNLRFFFIWLNLTYLFECSDSQVIERALVWTEEVKPRTKSQLSPWLSMKARLYAAMGDSVMEKQLMQQAEEIKNSSH